MLCPLLARTVLVPSPEVFVVVVADHWGVVVGERVGTAPMVEGKTSLSFTMGG